MSIRRKQKRQNVLEKLESDTQELMTQATDTEKEKLEEAKRHNGVME